MLSDVSCLGVGWGSNGVKWGRGLVVPCPLSHGVGAGAGTLNSKVQCIMGDGHMGLPPSLDRQTYTYENITFDTPLVGGNYIGRLSAFLGLS